MKDPRVKILSHNNIDLKTLTLELIGATTALIKVYENPWDNTKSSHYEQLTKQVKHVKDAITRYENKINFQE